MSRQIAVHLGLHRTGSTYLQRQVFRNIDGVFYAGKAFTRLRFPDVMMTERKVILFSNESWLGKLKLNSVFHPEWDWLDNSLLAIRNAARTFASPKAIVVIRQHSGWINSLYGSYLTCGGTESFEGFFNRIKKRKEFLLRPRLEAVVQEFGGRALFLDFADLKQNPKLWKDALSHYLGSEVKLPESAENEGITESGANTIRWLNRYRRLLPVRSLRSDPTNLNKQIGTLIGGPRLDIGEACRVEIDAEYREDWEAARRYLTGQIEALRGPL
jgi:hypothetical protein